MFCRAVYDARELPTRTRKDDRAIRVAPRIFDRHMVAGVPDSIAIEALSAEKDISFQMLQPPDQHLGRDASDDLVLDPAVQTSIGENLDPAARGLDGLAAPLDVQGLRGSSFHRWKSHSAILLAAQRFGERRAGELRAHSSWH